MLQRHWPAGITRSLTISGVIATIAFAYCVVNPHVFAPWLYSSHYNVSFLDLLGRINNLKQLHQMGNIYVWNGPEAFTYPPGAILFFWPLQFLSLRFWEYFSVLASLWAMSVSFAIVLHKLRQVAWRNALAVGFWMSIIFAAVYPPIMSDLVWGNISTVVLAATVIDFFVIPQKYRGAVTGLMAAVKIYPVIFIIWWAWRKRWTEVRSALIACLSLTAVAGALWWNSAYRFFATQVFGGGITQRFRGPSLNSSSILTFFTRPPFHGGDAPLWLVGVISVCLLVLAFRGAARLVNDRKMISAFIILSAIMRIIMPVAWDHYFVFIPFLIFVILELGWEQLLSKVSAIGMALLVMPWVFLRVSHPTPHSPIQALNNFLEQNVILAIMVALVIASNFYRSDSEAIMEPQGIDQ